MTAEIDANKSGNIEAMVKSRLNTSIAKIMAAMGALKIDDMAPAAAHPIKRLRVDWFIWNILEMFELIAAPVDTVGPSTPTDRRNPR